MFNYTPFPKVFRSKFYLQTQHVSVKLKQTFMTFDVT